MSDYGTMNTEAKQGWPGMQRALRARGLPVKHTRQQTRETVRVTVEHGTWVNVLQIDGFWHYDVVIWGDSIAQAEFSRSFTEPSDAADFIALNRRPERPWGHRHHNAF